MQILTRQNIVIDYCEDGYLCMGSTIVCPSKGTTFENCTIVTVDSIPVDIDSSSYLYQNGKFIKNYSKVDPNTLISNLGSNLKITTGSYTGDGESSKTLAFDFDPVLIFIQSQSADSYDNVAQCTLVKGSSLLAYSSFHSSSTSGISLVCENPLASNIITWGEKTVSWSNDSTLNLTDRVYVYVVIGK